MGHHAPVLVDPELSVYCPQMTALDHGVLSTCTQLLGKYQNLLWVTLVLVHVSERNDYGHRTSPIAAIVLNHQARARLLLLDTQRAGQIHVDHIPSTQLHSGHSVIVT